METDFRALYVDSGLNFSSLRRKNQFPNEVVHVFYKFSPPPSQLLRWMNLCIPTGQRWTQKSSHLQQQLGWYKCEDF